MVKYRILIIVFCIGLVISVKGQSKESGTIDKPNTILFAPLNLFDLFNPSLQIGFERRINEKYAFQLEGAYIINHSIENYLIDYLTNVKDCEFTNSGFKIRGELKYFLKSRRKIKPYISCELFYLKNKSRVQDTFIVSDTTYNYSVIRPIGQNAYDDMFINDKQRSGMNLKFGLKIYLGKRFLFEPYGGIGLVYRISKQYERENMNDEQYDDVLSFHNKAGHMWIPNLPMNFKFGYRF